MYNIRPTQWNIVGSRVADARKARKMNKEELCEKLQDLGVEMYNYELFLLEGQERKVLDFELVALAKALDVSVGWLMKQEE